MGHRTREASNALRARSRAREGEAGERLALETPASSTTCHRMADDVAHSKAFASLCKLHGVHVPYGGVKYSEFVAIVINTSY